MLIGTGALLTLVSENKHAQALNSIITNLNFSIESITRGLRTGTDFRCMGGGDCTVSGSAGMTFLSQTGVTTTYEFVASDSALYRCFDTSCTVSNRVRLTSPNVTVTSARFYVRGSGAYPTDTVQPHAWMTISGLVNYGSGKSEAFSVQTGVTQRAIDL